MDNKPQNLEPTVNYEFVGTGLTSAEKKKAQIRFNQYKTKHHVINFSTFPLLEELVYRETIQERYKRQVKKVAKTKNLVGEDTVPKHILNALNENLDQIIKLQDKLGFFTADKEKDFYTFIKQLDKKFELHRKENADEYLIPCPFCAKEFALKIRTGNYESFISPFFADGKILANKPLFDLYKIGKIMKEEVAKVLGTSPDYVDFLERHFKTHSI